MYICSPQYVTLILLTMYSPSRDSDYCYNWCVYLSLLYLSLYLFTNKIKTGKSKLRTTLFYLNYFFIFFVFILPSVFESKFCSHVSCPHQWRRG